METGSWNIPESAQKRIIRYSGFGVVESAWIIAGGQCGGKKRSPNVSKPIMALQEARCAGHVAQVTLQQARTEFDRPSNESLTTWAQHRSACVGEYLKS